MNKVILHGRIARDIESSTTQSGKVVARTAIAVDRRVPNRQEARAAGQQTADFIPLVFWEQKASFAQRYLMKGSQVLVEGRLQVRSYEDQQGQRRTFTEVIVENIEFAGARPQNSGDGYGSREAQPYNSPAAPFGGAPQAAMPAAPSLPDDEDVPF